MKKGKCFISPRIGFLACFLLIFLCSFFIMPSSSELSQTERDGRSKASYYGREHKSFSEAQQGVKKRPLSGDRLDEGLPDYRTRGLGYFDEDEVLIKFKPEAARMMWESLLQDNGMTIEKSFKHTGIHVIKLPSSMSVEKAIGILIMDPTVEYVEPNFIVSIFDVPNDPRFNELWGLHNTGQTGGKADADIDAPEAWDIHTGSGNVVVGVIDTGVDYTHQDLVDNMWVNQVEATGVPGVDDDSNGYVDDIYGINAITGSGDPMDDQGHGTHCAGTIGAVGNNAVGVVGVNWDVEIMGLKFLDSTGSGSISDAIECMEYVLNMHTKGVNIRLTSNSWGGGGYSQAAYDAISALRDEGILFIAAAGNDSSDNDASPHYPSSYDLYNIIAVAATDHNDELASFPTWGSNYGLTSVDVTAPGAYILSTLPGAGYEPGPGDIFFDHVEAGAGNWTADIPWGITEEISYSPTHSWTDSPDIYYKNNVDASLTSETVDLSGTTGQIIKLGFYAWIHLELDEDYLYIEVSGDGGITWITIGSLTGYEREMTLYRYFIPEAVRTNQFIFRFHLVTDENRTGEGVYIDDIGIGFSTGSNNYGLKSGTSMATPHVSGLAALIDSYRDDLNYLDIRDLICATVDQLSSLGGLIFTGGRINAKSALIQDPADLPPMIYSISPAQAPVGVEVTINGNRFGDTQGEVNFHEGIEADNIISWSNTSIVVTVPTGAVPGPLTLTTYEGVTSPGAYFRVGNFLNLHAFSPVAVCRAALAAVNGKAYQIGGLIQLGRDPIEIVQIYDPALNYWTYGTPKPSPAANAAVAVIDGKIYVAGGSGTDFDYLDVLEIYDPTTNTWTTGTSMPDGLAGSGAVALNGKLYVMGGGNSGGKTSAMREYNPSSGIWTQLASMNSPRSYMGTGLIAGKIYVFGGYDGTNFLSSLEVYDPGTNVWTNLASMDIPVYDLAGAALDDKLYAFGGNAESFWDPPYIQDIRVYDPGTDKWGMDSHLLNVARNGLRSTVIGSRMFIAGGYVGDDPMGISESLGLPLIPFNPVVVSYLSASLTCGIVPLEVSFAVEATGGSGSYTYSWSFGDGETSGLQNPTHTYDTAGTYDVTVTVTDAADTNNTTSGQLTVIVLEHPLSISSLGASPATGTVPLDVSFSVTATGGSGSYTYSWSFGDGETSGLQNPTHTYDTAGTYDAIVTVTDTGNPENSTTGRITIISLDQPVTLSVGITASPSSGPAPLTVTFAAAILGDSPPYTLEWDCGDGHTETQSTDSDTAQISHTYSNAGAYTVWVNVSSTAAGGNAIQSVQASIGISVTEPLEPPEPDDGPSCFIATAAYGSRMEPQVELLREFRDRFLLTNSVGKSFVMLYYACSPPVADFIAQNDSLRAVVRCALLPVVAVSWIAVHLGPILSLALVLLLLGLINVGTGITLKRVRFGLSGLGKRKTIG